MSARRLVPAVAAASLAALLAAAPAAAQNEAGSVPDLSGYWMLSFGPLPPNREPTALEQSLIDALPPDAELLADSGLAEFEPGEYGGLDIEPDALEAAQAYDPEVQVSPDTTCEPPGIIYSMQGPFPIEIFQGSELIVIKMEYFDLVRIVFMNEDGHPEDWPLSATGHSIGRWDDDTLVVETARLKPSTLFNNGLDHSENVRLVERFRLGDDGRTLAATQLIEDPQVFDGRAARVLSFERDEGHVYPYECDPTYGLAIEDREGG